jgi:hypothetical protein
VPDGFVEGLRSREVAGLVQLPKPRGLRRGDKVRIVHGALNGNLATFYGMGPHQRVEILMTMLGAQQRVVLPRRDIMALE